MNKLITICTLLLFSFIYSSKTYGQELELKYEFLCDITATLDNPIDVGQTPYGQRVIYPVNGGSFEGPKIKGKVLANGGDWLLRLDSTTSKLDVRAVLETEDGELIYTYYEGFIHENSDGSYYFRTNPVFQTSSKKYKWLNHTIAVGVGKIIDGGVTYKIYVIK
ncbi:DUF3237 domain-containing protein [Algoriphagus sp. SE2]|uniref:DUF3237 domain-containing protein n=1 Tax=Algoriphagus sp. SE2 TaxID=3141536 RepID=UPI0031CD2667